MARVTVSTSAIHVDNAAVVKGWWDAWLSTDSEAFEQLPVKSVLLDISNNVSIRGGETR